MSLRPKPEIEHLKVCPHGGPDYAELKAMNISLEEIIDFSGGGNPFMPLPAVKKALNTVAINQYPDPEATQFRQRLSEKLGVAPDNIMAGNGAAELIHLIAVAYFGHGDSVLILKPTFGEYEVACQIVGAAILKQWARPEEDFAPRIEETINLIQQHRPKGIFICNPNNPTGRYLGKQEIEAVLNASRDSLLVLDEAYISFVRESWSSIDLISRGNAVIVRSMTKDYALAGLRLGYVVASEEIIDNLRRVRPPWNVNVMAQKAGVVVLEDTDYLERCEPKIRRAKQFLTTELHLLGFTLVPSMANFFLIRVGNARAFRTALLRRGILVRDCTSLGLPEYVRIMPLAMPECKKLIATVQTLKHEGGLDANI